MQSTTLLTLAHSAQMFGFLLIALAIIMRKKRLARELEEEIEAEQAKPVARMHSRRSRRKNKRNQRGAAARTRGER